MKRRIKSRLTGMEWGGGGGGGRGDKGGGGLQTEKIRKVLPVYLFRGENGSLSA